MTSKSWPALQIEIRPASEALQTAASTEDLIGLILDDLGVTAVEEVSPTRWRVFFKDSASRALAAGRLGVAAEVRRVEPVDVPDEDWVVRTQADFRSMTVGRVTVAPPWDVGASPGAVVVIIEPSMGFGTGQHPSTRLCLQALAEIALEDRTVLDVGTGSAVLALAAALLGAERVTGIDCDPDAVGAARRNRALNSAASVEIELADLATLSTAPRDVVLANLTAGVLSGNAARLGQLVAPGGCLVASGFTRDQESEVAKAFAGLAPPLHATRRLSEDDWLAAVFQRP